MTGRSLASLGLMLATLAGLAQTRPAWMHDLGMDWWGLPELYRVIDSERERKQQIDAYGDVVQARYRAKQAVLEELLAGRMALVKAAALFRALDQTMPQGREHIDRFCVGMGEGERTCLEVLGHVRGRYRREMPSPIQALVDRLSVEVEDQVCSHGDVALPAVEWLPPPASTLRVRGGPALRLADAAGGSPAILP
jgi:hypothetical protein